MRLRFLLVSLSLPALAACLFWAFAPGHPLVARTRTLLPGPLRAKEAALRTRPALERELAAMGLHAGDPVFLRAFKEEAELELWVRRRDTGKYQLFRTWRIAAQSGGPGPKLREGDGQVPEGFYFASRKSMKPNSDSHLAINIGYPNAFDRHHGRTGSAIMIHGDQVSIGCLAMTDEKIEEIYTLCDAALANGQQFFRIHVFPFRMSAARMEREKASPWFDFWTQLREGYDWFGKHQVPPEATVEDGRYRFEVP